MGRLRPDQPAVALSVARLEGRASFSVVGDLDLATEGVLRRALAPVVEPGTTVVLDVSGLTFVDSTGLNLFIDIVERLGAGGNLRFLGASPFFRQLFHVSGLERHPNMSLEGSRNTDIDEETT